MSKIEEVYETLTTTIKSSKEFKRLPVYWDDVETTPNTIKTPCVLIKARAWRKGEFCDFERQLDFEIFVQTESPRDILVQLWNYAEDLYHVLEEAIPQYDFDLTFRGGSEIGALKPNKKDAESYKSTGTLFTSIIVLTYNLRY